MLYNPPISHYSEMDVSQYDEDDMFKFVGRDGKKFYHITRVCGLDYLWYDRERKKIEIWGPYHVHVNRQTAHLIEAELEHFFERVPRS